MADSQYDQFLDEATTLDPDAENALGRSCLYGLYLSWCFLGDALPRTERSFWAAMKENRVRPDRAGLRMKGPAAVDYILASSPALV